MRPGRSYRPGQSNCFKLGAGFLQDRFVDPMPRRADLNSRLMVNSSFLRCRFQMTYPMGNPEVQLGAISKDFARTTLQPAYVRIRRSISKDLLRGIPGVAATPDFADEIIVGRSWAHLWPCL